ncbi:MAG: LytTR family transcriptional regulator [Bacteroidia bacterium]|nr:LytTR family transcriptional regulator [Bacteroidia bacterium]
MVAHFLRKPFHHNTTTRFALSQAILFGLFVFVFLRVFKPFGIHQVGDRLTTIALGFGGVTAGSMILLNVCIPALRPRFFELETWTVGKEIAYSLLNVWFIGVMNFLFFSYGFPNQFQWTTLFWFQLFTIAIGLFPVTLVTFYKERINYKRFSDGSKELNALHNQRKPGNPTNAQIVIRSKNKSENLELHEDDLCFIRASDNYVEVHYKVAQSTEKKLLRNGLKDVALDLETKNQFFRCHKSYLVNLNRVTRISGNAQGYRLHLEGMEKRIPVSRKFNNSIKERLSVHT